ncbi:uncharacterized protein LOC127749224 [Frankliniella occidentalis]|uniref:Uncharacterized protein LOC127749224 n=1 Tax=Frankliniella occidentalis TaxID=133901 RepID=A0A9C6WZ71_FRAOC|nr:uncharacterized protein LOC127749224 [Frankliniella occidentalis]
MHGTGSPKGSHPGQARRDCLPQERITSRDHDMSEDRPGGDLTWTSAKQPMCHLHYAELASQHTAEGIAPFSHDRRNESGIQIHPKSPAETSQLLEEDLLL